MTDPEGLSPRVAIAFNLGALSRELVTTSDSLERSIGALARWIVRHPEALEEKENATLNRHTKLLEKTLESLRYLADVYKKDALRMDEPWDVQKTSKLIKIPEELREN